MINKSFILKISFLISFCVGNIIPALSNAKEVLVSKKAIILNTSEQSIPFSEDAIEESFYTPLHFFTTTLTNSKNYAPIVLKTIPNTSKYKKSKVLVLHRFINFKNIRI